MLRPRAARGSLLLLCLFVAGSSLACSRPADPGAKPRLVVLYAPCSLRCPSLEPYAKDVPFTPNLAAFARESVVFEKHVTETPESGIAYASIFTGMQAKGHHVFHHPVRLEDGLPTIAKSFADDGYECWFWAGHPMANAALNYGAGVPEERVVTSTGKDRPNQWVPGRAVTMTANDERFAALLDDLEAHPEKRAFVQVDFTLCHDPYYQFCSKEDVAKFLRDFPERAHGVTPEEVDRFAELYGKNYGAFQWNYDEIVRQLDLGPSDRTKLALVMQALYETDVRELDRWFGSFLEKIRARGLANDSVIAFTADHGEALDRENLSFRFGHGLQLVPETVRVPFLIRAPGRLAPKSYAAVTRSIDVFPTLAGLCGVAVPQGAGIEGVDLSPALRGERPPPELLAYSHTAIPSKEQAASLLQYEAVRKEFPTFRPDEMRVRVENDKIACELRYLSDGGSGFVAHDLSKDPLEEHDLFDPKDAEMSWLAHGLEEYKSDLIEAYDKTPAAQGSPSEEEIRRMKSLGYVK
jgi:arylsulfatase A-like enzyme